MLTAALSSLALAMTLSAHMQVGLQAVLNDAQPVEESAELVEDTIEEIVETAAPVPTPEPETELAEAVTEPAPTEAIVLAQNDTPVEEEAQPEPTPQPVEVQAPEATQDDLTVPPQNGEIPEEDWPAILSAASTALAAAETATGRFIQTNADGSITPGSFALNRPGRMRFDYDDPTPILIVSDGTTVAMEDSELETVDRVPIGSTPLGLILSTDLNVDEDVEILGVMENSTRVGIRVSDAKGELEGTLTMVFDKADFQLVGWLATDGNFQTTVVDLVDVETNGRVDPRLFRLNEDEDEEDER